MNTNSFSNSYKEAGVDVTAGYKAVELMKQHVARTMTSGVLSGIGGFGGLFELDMTGITKPVLVSGTDGVGTKLKIAFLMDKHDTVGIDCVAMCVNDIICCGAKPQFFLDYIAVGKNYPEKIAQIVSGVAEGCVQSGCALIGGETAEMPGFYPVDEYDLAGFSVGVVDKDKILDPSTQKAADAIGPYSQAMKVGNLVFTSGQIAIDPATGNVEATTIEEQTHQVCKNLTNVLEAAGTSIGKAVKTVCFLKNMSDFGAFNGVYGEYFTSKPARSCVAAKELPKDVLVEVEVIAEV